MVADLSILLLFFGVVTASRDDDRIVGGEPINITKVPYQASLAKFGYHFCGCSIISDKFILSARHCLSGGSHSNVIVRYGNSNLNEGRETNIIRVIYPNSQGFTLISDVDYDVIVAEVHPPFEIGEYARPILLPDKPAPTGKALLVTGWGDTQRVSNELMGATVNVVDMKTCNASYNYELTPRMLCAKAPGKDSCQGDSGGPAAADGVIYGIVSFGRGCADPKYPGVYVNVGDPNVLKFIRTAAGLPR